MNVFKVLQMLPLLIEAISQLIIAIKKLQNAVDDNTLVRSNLEERSFVPSEILDN